MRWDLCTPTAVALVGRCRGIPLRAVRANLDHHPSAVNERQSTTPEGDLPLRERISHALPFRQSDRSMRESEQSFQILCSTQRTVRCRTQSGRAMNPYSKGLQMTILDPITGKLVKIAGPRSGLQTASR